MIPNIKYKTSMCKDWEDSKLESHAGEKCPKAANCYFAHGHSDLRTIEQNSQEMAYRHELLRNYQCYNGYKPKELQNYKTVRCRFFVRGECKLGDNCTFAHSNEEIRLKVTYDEYLKLQHFIYYGQFYTVPGAGDPSPEHLQLDQNNASVGNFEQLDIAREI